MPFQLEVTAEGIECLACGIGLAIGAAMALTETGSTEEQAIQDEQNFNEFLVQLEAEEEEQTFQLSM